MAKPTSWVRLGLVDTALIAAAKRHTGTAGEDKRFDPGLSTCVDDVIGRQFVDRVKMLPRSPHAGDCSGMDDRIHFFDCRCGEGSIGQIALQLRHAERDQVGVAAARDTDDLITPRDQLTYDLATQKAAATGY